MKHLINGFKKAGLALQILDKPIRGNRELRRGTSLIFQMDIQRVEKGTRRFEKFRIYPGHKDNLIQIRNVDHSSRQLLLMVKEPAGRTFEDSIKITGFNTKERILSSLQRNMRVKGISKGHVIVTVEVPEEVRYFLLGVDERQLFVAQLRGSATTVKEAHRSLGNTIQFADGKRKGSIDRQGEWFFLQTSQVTRDTIEAAIKQNRTAVQKKISIGLIMGRGGNPHTVDELVVLPRAYASTIRGAAGTRERVLLRRRVFIRGCVRHKDHKTIKFGHWREVIANNEGATSNGASSGVFWID